MSVQEPANTAARSLYQAMIGAPGPEAIGWTGSPGFRPQRGRGDGNGNVESVLILGAGIGGLTAAYELSKLGYSCTVLEARPHPGGRSRTVRRGDRLYEIGPSGAPYLTHTCSFDQGLYLNLGPGRIPYHHRRVLKHCRDLQVPLEPYVMEATANLIAVSQDGPVRWHSIQVANDTRGHLAAFLASKLTGEDEFAGKLRDLLRVFGDLDADGEYHGSTRSGYAEDLDVLTSRSPWPR
jgi:monoamine oxidase